MYQGGQAETGIMQNIANRFEPTKAFATFHYHYARIENAVCFAKKVFNIFISEEHISQILEDMTQLAKFFFA